jgi:hypothetical protein
MTRQSHLIKEFLSSLWWFWVVTVARFQLCPHEGASGGAQWVPSAWGIPLSGSCMSCASSGCDMPTHSCSLPSKQQTNMMHSDKRCLLCCSAGVAGGNTGGCQPCNIGLTTLSTGSSSFTSCSKQFWQVLKAQQSACKDACLYHNLELSSAASHRV